LEVLLTENLRGNLELRAFPADIKKVVGGLLVQTPDLRIEDAHQARVVTRRPPSGAELRAMNLGIRISEHIIKKEIADKYLDNRFSGCLEGVMKANFVLLGLLERGNFRRYNDLVFERFWKRELDIEDPAAMGSVVQACGLNAQEFSDFEEEGRRDLNRICREAVALRIFGVPSFVVDGEIFWGGDRIWMVREKLESGRGEARKTSRCWIAKRAGADEDRSMTPDTILIVIVIGVTTILQLAGLGFIAYQVRMMNGKMIADDASIFVQGRQVQQILREMREMLRDQS